MEIPKFLILLCCAYHGFASHDGHTIPVENYETELHDLGETVDIPETPVRVIKITKTVAVKVPVPYPVKVIEKVPYPVHISKPYPVPVPQIVKVPHVESPKPLHGHEALGSNDDLLHRSGHDGNYQVQEIHSPEGVARGDGNEQGIQSYNGGHSNQPQQYESYGGNDYSEDGPGGNSYEAPYHNNYYGGAGGNDADSFESQNYNQAIKNYLQNINSGGNAGHSLHNYN